jgi:quercetin dioxygenase-like cupin family protein
LSQQARKRLEITSLERFAFDSRKDDEMKPTLYSHWKEKVVFSSDGPQPQVLVEDEKFKVIMAGLEPGQKIPQHPAGLAMYHFLDGTGWMNVDGERFAVGPGATVTVPAGAKRGIEADTRLVFLAARST